MKWILRKCSECYRYTLKWDKCPYCGGKLFVPHPPRFSPEDKYVGLRLRMKIESRVLELSEEPAQRLRA